MRTVVYLFVFISILTSCGEEVTTKKSIPKQESNETIAEDPIVVEEEQLDLDSLIGFNDLFEMLPALGPVAISNGVQLSSRQVLGLPVELRSYGDNVVATCEALSRYSNEGDRAFVLHVHTYDSTEIEVFQEDDSYYLVLIDGLGYVGDVEQVHEKTTLVNGNILSSGWYEMEYINISWKKLNLYKTSITILEEDSKTFQSEELGYNEAQTFQDKLHDDLFVSSEE
jgi:hypothetical protein